MAKAKSFKRTLWLAALIVLLLGLAAGAGYPLFIHKQAAKEQAGDAGRRITVLLENGEILEGNISGRDEKSSLELDGKLHGQREEGGVSPSQDMRRPEVEAGNRTEAYGEVKHALSHEEYTENIGVPKHGAMQREEGAELHMAEETQYYEEPSYNKTPYSDHAVSEQQAMVQNQSGHNPSNPKEAPSGAIPSNAGAPHYSEAAPSQPSSPEPHSPQGTATASSPKIAIMIGGLGLSSSTTERALSLPKEISMGFSPYAHDMVTWSNQARHKGHEIYVNIPMEPVDYPAEDTGPYALLTNLENQENLKRLSWVLSRAKGYKGVYTAPNEKFTYSQKTLVPVLEYIHQNHLQFVYGGGYNNTGLLQLGKKLSQPIIVGDLILDEKISAESIKERLKQLETVALESGYALGIGNPYPLTVKVVENWLPTLSSKGIKVVPVSVLPSATTHN